MAQQFYRYSSTCTGLGIDTGTPWRWVRGCVCLHHLCSSGRKNIESFTRVIVLEYCSRVLRLLDRTSNKRQPKNPAIVNPTYLLAVGDCNTSGGLRQAPKLGAERKMGQKKLRLGLCRNTGANRGVVQATIVAQPTFEAIMKAAVNKLKLSKKKAKSGRLFVARCVLNVSACRVAWLRGVECMR